MATTPQHPAQRHPAAPPAQRPNQPQGTAQPTQRQHEDASRPKAADVNKGRDPNSPSGVASDYNTKPENQGGGDQSAHPSPATDPTNAAPEPAQWTDDNPRPPLPKGRDYVAGQPVTQEEYELTEKEQAERVRPEAWERLKGQGVEVEEGMKDGSTGWSRDKEGTRPDARHVADPGGSGRRREQGSGRRWRARHPRRRTSAFARHAGGRPQRSRRARRVARATSPQRRSLKLLNSVVFGPPKDGG